MNKRKLHWTLWSALVLLSLLLPTMGRSTAAPLSPAETPSRAQNYGAISLDEGAYPVTVSKSDYAFTPYSHTLTGPSQPLSTTPDVIDQNFTSTTVMSASAQNVEFVGHIGGTTNAVFVEGNYAYIGEGPRLTILDISNPAALTVVGKTMPLPGVVQDVYVFEGSAYVTTGRGGLRVVDVSNPTSPVEIGFCDTLGYTLDAVVSGSYVYVGTESSGLHVIDITNPTAYGGWFLHDVGECERRGSCRKLCLHC
jgi:hypothetical protein